MFIFVFLAYEHVLGDNLYLDESERSLLQPHHLPLPPSGLHCTTEANKPHSLLNRIIFLYLQQAFTPPRRQRNHIRSSAFHRLIHPPVQYLKKENGKSRVTKEEQEPTTRISTPAEPKASTPKVDCNWNR
ncbi:hypothetical protein E2C01_094996 [Portunus trituberculatus]|uniref:Uncharacterized protein n=1 Tax=Portunus trituberculatus TaxID=210409 RepID=A0A5B7JYP5_PORTR|nr:hypothetical protein [Portunus trituberculatus]